MSNVSNLVGHPGLAPLLWWVIGLAITLDLVYAFIAVDRYRRARTRRLQEKTVILLSLSVQVCLNNSMAFMLGMSQLMLIGAVPFPIFFYSMVGILCGVLVFLAAP
jgi:hypothetical protein